MLTRIALLTLTFAGLVVVAPTALASDLPYNPYSGPRRPRTESDREPVRGMRTARRLPQLDSREYPQGRRGPRHVHVEIGSAEREAIARLIIERARRHDQDYRLGLKNHDRAIRDYGQRLAAMQMNRNDSREDFSRWLDFRAYVERLTQTRDQIRADQMKARDYYRSLVKQIRHSGSTIVVWNVQNHQNRVYVPTDYLRRKAIGYLAKHLDRLGHTTRLNF